MMEEEECHPAFLSPELVMANIKSEPDVDAEVDLSGAEGQNEHLSNNNMCKVQNNGTSEPDVTRSLGLGMCGMKRVNTEPEEATTSGSDRKKTASQIMNLLLKDKETDKNSVPGKNAKTSVGVSGNLSVSSMETVCCMDTGEVVPDVLLYCIECLCSFEGDCPTHGPLIHIRDTPVDDAEDKYRDVKSAPTLVRIQDSLIPNAGLGLFARTVIPDRSMFGPYEGKAVSVDECSEYAWLIRKNGELDHCVDALEPSCSNWLRFANCPRFEAERNLFAFQYLGNIYYRTVRQINPGEELLVWYGDACAQRLGLDPRTMDHHKFKGEERVRKAPMLFPCVICLEIFRTKEERDAHRPIHTDGAFFVCPLCAKKFAKYQHLKRHIRTHNEEDEEGIPCPLCDERLSNQVGLRKHLLTHSGIKPFSCAECSKRFSRQDDLNRHLRFHTGEKIYKCTVCDKKFVLRESLQKHRCIAHQGEAVHKCRICFEMIFTREQYDKHVESHSKEKPFSCSDCGRGFAQKTHLNVHQRLSHCGKKPFSCVHCSRAFLTEKELSLHMITHTGEKKFPCTECDEQFLLEHQLLRHLKVHKNDKPFVCPVCSTRYSKQQSLTAHLRHHNNASQFVFVDCNSDEL